MHWSNKFVAFSIFSDYQGCKWLPKSGEASSNSVPAKEVCNGGVACSLAADKPRPLLQNSVKLENSESDSDTQKG